MLAGPPEPEQRKSRPAEGPRRAWRASSATPPAATRPPGPQPRLSRLEHTPHRRRRRGRGAAPTERPTVEAALTAKQRELLAALLAAPSVSAAATELGMSRSNVYASLRRIGRKLGIADVSELLRLLRAGSLDARARALT